MKEKLVEVEKGSGGRGVSRYVKYYNMPVVIIASFGDIYLTEAAMEQLGHPQYVAVAQGSRSFGIRPATADDVRVAFKVGRNGREGTTGLFRVAAKQFTKGRNLCPEKGRSAVYLAEMDEDSGYLMVNLVLRPDII